MKVLEMQKNKTLDFICVGRANIDLYAVERDTDLQTTSGFVKSIGGTPANIAVALSRLGAKVGFVGKISEDALGEYVFNYLESKGLDVTHLTYDYSGSRTSLVFAEVKKDNCEVLFYRNKASDLCLSSDDIEEEYIKKAKVVILTGTALTASPSREAMFSIINYARQNQTLVVFDLDYRASEWKNIEEASIYYNLAAKQADIIIGNNKEFDILDYIHTAEGGQFIPKRYLNSITKMVLNKNGGNGSIIYTKDKIYKYGVFKVEKLKPYGSGDAYAATFLNALVLDQKPIEESLELAAAAGAILVSKPGCAEAMPSKEEVLQFIKLHKKKK